MQTAETQQKIQKVIDAGRDVCYADCVGASAQTGALVLLLLSLFFIKSRLLKNLVKGLFFGYIYVNMLEIM